MVSQNEAPNDKILSYLEPHHHTGHADIYIYIYIYPYLTYTTNVPLHLVS
jgi:hypothetical protein